MKLNCDEATSICDKNQYGEASLWEKIKLTFHMFLCGKCGLYSKQNNVMTSCYESHKEFAQKNKKCLNEKEKKSMETTIKAEI